MALNIAVRADDVVLPGNPYTLIVARNIFNLSPAPPPVDPSMAEPAVKITPNGTMSILGQLQVLFKTSGGGKPGDQSYILREGQRQDDIEVTKIDEKKGIVTFNNHGLVQQLPLTSPPVNTSPTATAAAFNPVAAFPTVAPAANGGNNGGQNNFGGGSGNYDSRPASQGRTGR